MAGLVSKILQKYSFCRKESLSNEVNIHAVIDAARFNVLDKKVRINKFIAFPKIIQWC